MKTKLTTMLCLVTLPFVAMGQFIGAPDDTPPAWTSFKLNAKKRIKLDFRNASVDAITTFLSVQSGITIVKDPTLTGTMNLVSATPVSLSDAFQILSTTLSLKNFSLVKEGKLLVIRSKNQGNRNQMPSFDPSIFTQGGNLNLKVYVMKYANASQISRVINDVFAASGSSPMDAIMQMMQQGRQQGGRQPGGFGGGVGGGFQGRFGGGGASTSNVKASSDDFSNSVIVNAPSAQQQQVADLIRQLDVQTDEPQKSKVFPLKFASATDLTPVVQNVLNSNAPRGKGGATTQQTQGPQAFIQALRGQTAGSGQVTSDPRTNSLVVTATDENLVIVGRVINELDTEVKIENATFVVPLSNARADQIATLLQSAFGTRQGTTNRNNTNTQGGRVGGNTNATNRNTGNRNNTGGAGGLGGSIGDGGVAQIDKTGQNLELALADPNSTDGELMTSIGVQQGGGFQRLFGGGGGQGQTQNSTQTGRDANGRLVNIRDLTNQITVIPDINTNSLIIVATPDGADLIRSIIEQLDRIPEQVMIETIIVEASLDDESKLGIEWNYSNTHKGVTQGVGQGFGLQNTTPAPTGLKYTLSGGNLTAFMNAIATNTKFTVLSTPRIFTSNNVQASINISQSIPYVLSTRTDANGNLTFNYAFQDVGIVLTVMPRITANGYVTMDVTQTANDLQGYTTFNAPIVNQREADTTVSVKDGETIILGGIIRNNVSTTTNKIPLLGDIPILGHLFRSTNKTNSKTELMVLLTPHVVRNPEDAAKLRESETKRMSVPTQKALGGVIDPKGTTPPPAKGDGKPPIPPTGGG